MPSFRCTLPIRPPSLSLADFQRDFVNAGEPVVIRGLGAGWPALEGYRSRSAFGSAHGEARHEVRWPGGARAFGILSRNASVSQFLAEMQHPDAGMLFSATTVGRTPRNKKRRSTRVNRDGEEAGEWATPKLFVQSRAWQLDEPVLSLAPTRRGLPFHNHGSAWVAVIVGRKLVMVVPPLHAPIPTAAMSSDEQAALFVGSPWDFVRKHHPRLAPRLQPRGCILEPGDAIFIPCNHYHLTMNVGDTIAVGGTLDPASANADVCTATSTPFSTVSRALLSSTQPRTHCGLCLTACPHGAGADWCFESDAVTNLGRQAHTTSTRQPRG